MASAPVVPTAPVPKVSWLHKVGAWVQKALGIIIKDAVPVAGAAGAIIDILDPAAAPLVLVAENLISRIASQVVIVQAAFAGVQQGSNNSAKLQAVIDQVGPFVDQWVANSFPGAGKVSASVHAGLVNAVVALINDIDGNLALVAPSTAAMAAASAASAAVTAAMHGVTVTVT
jgi:hypothetical protein